MWRLSSPNGASWVQYNDGGGFTGSVDMQTVIADSRPVEIAPMSGQMYTPTGPNDQVAVFLRARNILGRPFQVVGAAPAVPLVAGGDLPGIVS